MNWLHFNKRTLDEAPRAPDVTADSGVCAHSETRGQIGLSALRENRGDEQGLSVQSH